MPLRTLAEDVKKDEVSAYYSENNLKDGIFPFKTGQIIVVTDRCENQFVDLMLMREVTNIIEKNLNIYGGSAMAMQKKNIRHIPVSRTQSTIDDKLTCTVASFFSNEDLMFNLSDEEVFKLKIDFLSNVILNESISVSAKADIFRKNKINDLASVYHLKSKHNADLFNLSPDLSWLDVESDRDSNLKSSFEKVKLSLIKPDVGDTIIINFARSESIESYKSGDAKGFIKWSSILLSRNLSEAETWTKLSSVLRSEKHNDSAIIALYYAMSLTKVSGYDLMSLAVLRFNKSDVDQARILAEISKQLDPNNQWVIKNYANITN